MTNTLLAIYLIGLGSQLAFAMFFLIDDSNSRGFRLLITSPVWPLVYLKAVWRML